VPVQAPAVDGAEPTENARSSTRRFSYASEKCVEFHFVEASLGAHAAADVHPEWSHGFDSLGDIRRIEATGKKNGNPDGVANASAYLPVMPPAGSSELFHRESWIAGVEQDCIDLGAHRIRLIDRFLTGDMYHLNESDVRECIAKVAMAVGLDMVDQLNCIDPRAAHLVGDGGSTHLAGQKECRDSRGHAPGDLYDQLVVDHSRPTWHRRHEPDRVGAPADCQLRLGHAAHAADLYVRALRLFNRERVSKKGMRQFGKSKKVSRRSHVTLSLESVKELAKNGSRR
jgi:hypothetical protein